MDAKLSPIAAIGSSCSHQVSKEAEAVAFAGFYSELSSIIEFQQTQAETKQAISDPPSADGARGFGVVPGLLITDSQGSCLVHYACSAPSLTLRPYLTGPFHGVDTSSSEPAAPGEEIGVRPADMPCWATRIERESFRSMR